MGPLAAYAFFFFFNDTATTEIYTLSLHDALPILLPAELFRSFRTTVVTGCSLLFPASSRWRSSKVPSATPPTGRSEEHTSELQSLRHLVCRLLLEKKKKKHM